MDIQCNKTADNSKKNVKIEITSGQLDVILISNGYLDLNLNDVPSRSYMKVHMTSGTVCYLDVEFRHLLDVLSRSFSDLKGNFYALKFIKF